MKLFTTEIRGKPIAVFDGADTEFADWFVSSPAFRLDLQELDSFGKPLWNGTDEISFRAADSEEAEQWTESRELLLDSGELDEDIQHLHYLLPVERTRRITDKEIGRQIREWALRGQRGVVSLFLARLYSSENH